MELNKELLEKVKKMKTPEELLAFAKENGIEMTKELSAFNAYSCFSASEVSNSRLLRQFPDAPCFIIFLRLFQPVFNDTAVF